MISLLELRSEKTATSQKVDNPARKHLYLPKTVQTSSENSLLSAAHYTKIKKKVLIYHFDLISCMFIVFNNSQTKKLWISDKLA